MYTARCDDTIRTCAAYIIDERETEQHTHTHTHTIGVVCAFEAQIRREERPKDARTRKTIHTNFIVCFVRFFLFDSMHAMILIE